MATKIRRSSVIKKGGVEIIHTVSGSLVLSGCLGDGELAAMRADMDRVAGEAHPDAPDYLYGAGHLDGSQVLRRIQYVVDKSRRRAP